VNRAEREQLAKLARQRARLAKSEAVEREKILISEVHDLMSAEFSAQDKLWTAAVAIAREAADKANDLIRAQCIDLGIEARYAPELQLGWRSRSDAFIDPDRRAELRRLAVTRLAALTQAAKTAIDRECLRTETELVREGLESSEAIAFLDRMPTAEQLMPAIGLDDLGVKRWQPAADAASALLTPSTPADRKRKAVLRAIEANPGASNRQVAAIAGCDHKTVAAYRAAGEPAGEIPGVRDRAGQLPGEE
jgi:hypothetical protein